LKKVNLFEFGVDFTTFSTLFGGVEVGRVIEIVLPEVVAHKFFDVLRGGEDEP
jgi:hypothetical protein